MYRLVLAAAAAAFLALAASAHGARPFATPRTLFAPGTFADARMNAGGDVAIAWEGAPGASPAAGKVEAVTAPGGGDFSAVQRLASGNVGGVRLALGGDGRVAAIWNDPAADGVGLATGNVPGGFGSSATFRVPGRMATAVGPAGQAVAVWADRGAGAQAYTRVLASYRPAGGSFGGAFVLGEHGSVDPHPAVAIDPGSTVVAAWRAGATATGPHQVWTATIPAGGRPTEPASLSPPGDDARTAPRLALGERGDVAAWWYGTSAGSPPTGSRVAVRPLDERFGPAETVAGAGAGDLRVAFDRQGAALAVWSDRVRRGRRTTRVLGVRRRPPGGPFGALETFAVPRLFPGSHHGGLDPRGNAVVAWGEDRERSRGWDPVLLAAVQRPGERFGLPMTLARRTTPEALVFGSYDGGYLVARGWRGSAVLAFGYASRLLDVPVPGPLDGLAVNVRRRRVRFLATEPGRVVARVDRVRSCRRCARYRLVSRRTVGVGRGRRSVYLAGRRGRRLGPGAYRLSLGAHDLTGRRLALRRVAFRVPRG